MLRAQRPPSQLDSSFHGVRLSEKAHLTAEYTVASWAPESFDDAAPGQPVPPSLLAVGTRSGAVILWDTSRGEVVARLGTESDAVGTTPSAGGKRPRQQPHKGGASSSRHTTPISALVWSSDGSHVYSGAEGSGTVICWDVAEKRALRVFACDRRGCSALALSHDAATLFAAYMDILVIDTASGRSIKRLAGHALPVSALRVASEDDVSGEMWW